MSNPFDYWMPSAFLNECDFATKVTKISSFQCCKNHLKAKYLTIKYLAFCFDGVTGSEYRHQDYDALPHLYQVGDEGAAFGVGDLDVLLTVLDGILQWLL